MNRKEIACVVCESRSCTLLTTAKGNRGLDYIAAEHPVVVCSNCGLVYLNPQHSDDDYSRYYATEDYKPITTQPAAFLNRHIYRKIQSAYLLNTLTAWHGLIPPSTTAIDVGCGPGVMLHHLAQAGLSVTGLEASANAANYAENAFGLNIIRGYMGRGTLPPESFDVAISTASIEHFTNPLFVLEEMWKSLKPEGLLYVNTLDLFGMVLKKGEGSQFKFVHTYYFTEISLTNLIEKAGFKVIRSWVMPPQLRASVIYPGNYCSGELNIIAVKTNISARAAVPRRTESASDLVDCLRLARQRDNFHARAHAMVRIRFFARLRSLVAQLIKPRAVYANYIGRDGVVKCNIFPPLIVDKSTVSALEVPPL